MWREVLKKAIKKDSEKRRNKVAGKKNFNTGVRGEMYKLLLAYGMVTYDGLNMLHEHEKRIYQRGLKKMQKENLVNVKWMKGGRRKYAILNNREIKNEKDMYDEELYLSQYEAVGKDNSHNTSDSRNFRVEKVYRGAKVYQMMYGAGINCMPTDKMKLLCVDDDRVDTAYGLRDMLAYYGDAEVKDAAGYKAVIGVGDKKGDRVLFNTRAHGVMCSEDRVYIVYNTEDKLMVWTNTAEQKFMYTARDVISRTYGVNMNQKPCGIVIGSTMEMSKRILTQPIVLTADKTSISPNNPYDHLYSIPYDIYGQKMLELMQNSKWEQALKDKYLSGLSQLTVSSGVDCDGVDKENRRYVLLYAIPDINRLYKFLANAGMREDKENFEIICYEWQREFIEDVTEGRYRVTAISDEEFFEDIEKIGYRE